MRPFLLLCFAAAFLGCPAPTPVPDAAVVELDAGVEPTACDSPDDCVAVGGACRQLICETDVPCSDDLECGLGERCVGSQCRFRGCTTNADCPTGFCDTPTYSCAECGASSDCPQERPVCDTGLRQCVQCTNDAQCQPPGPSHCSTNGRCVGCLADAHCPNGLQCSSGNFCVGSPSNAPCPEGTSCGAGLVCVLLNQSPVCLEACALYQPNCATGQICFGLNYSSTTSLVFESMGPIGVCFAPNAGFRGLREPCVRDPATGTSNCQPNLQCIPETASLALCRPYCNPFASGTCPVGEKCTPFVGDYSGREFGVCIPDTGFGAKCKGDPACRPGLTCQPYDDPSDLDEVGSVCQFNVGDGGAFAPCRDVPLADGGVIAADRTCKSGNCVNDPLVFTPATPPYYCFAGCAADADCGDAGVCDSDFPVVTAYGTEGYVRGCRPRCEAESDCAGYDAGLTCRVRVVASSSTPQFTTTCSPSSGLLPAGAPCTANGQCRSILCMLDDSRGVRRQGTCVNPCRDGEGCAVHGGTLPLACAPTTYLVSRGFDGVAGTFDDKFSTPRLCAGAACTSDLDCRPDGGSAVCAAELSVANPFGAVGLRCRARTSGSLRGGDPCIADSQCESGACGTLQSPSTGTGRACFEACTGATVCAASMTCRVGGLQLPTQMGPVSLDSCAP
ncbi:MAG: hypothetical protein Q8L48_17805 [Archangium sp.]|nr:hypothetical protein [Archangium sp.]